MICENVLQVVIALGKMWHPEHYVCCQCGEELGHRNFFERAGKAYCEDDYHDMFSPRCAYCNGPIKDASFLIHQIVDHEITKLVTS